MRYSDAFEQLYEMSIDLNLRSTVQYKCVAIFIGRVMMANNDTAHLPHRTDRKPAGEVLPWMFELKGLKEKILPYIIQLSEAEWEKIRKAMMGYAANSDGRDEWKAKRVGWVNSLDTMRAFERE
jgi:hypothetical protein